MMYPFLNLIFYMFILELLFSPFSNQKDLFLGFILKSKVETGLQFVKSYYVFSITKDSHVLSKEVGGGGPSHILVRFFFRVSKVDALNTEMCTHY